MVRVAPSSARSSAARGFVEQHKAAASPLPDPKQRGSRCVDRAVASPDDDQVAAIVRGRSRELARVTGALGEMDVAAKPPPIERIGNQRPPLFSDARIGAGAGNRVDDRNDLHDSLL